MEGSESEPSNTMPVEEIPPPLPEQPPVPPVEPSFVEDPPQSGESAEINVLHADEPAAADDPSTSEEPEAAAPEPAADEPAAAAPAAEDGDAEEWNGEDCGKCDMCLDKPKYGGEGKKKKACEVKTAHEKMLADAELADSGGGGAAALSLIHI